MSDRWPMTRGELATRLSKALDGKPILIARDPRIGGERYYAPALSPAGLALELVGAIDAQGTDDKQLQRAAEIAMCRAEGARCDREGGPCTCPCPPEDERGTPGTADGPPLPMPPDAPYPLVTEYADLTAAATIIRELNALSGTSGAGWDHAVNVLRFAAGHFGYQLTEQET